MVTIVRCPVCKETLKIRDHQRFFIHCRLTSIVKDNFVARGAPRAQRIGRGEENLPPASPIPIEPEPFKWDQCGKCKCRFKSFGENVPEKCPVCGAPWR